MVMVFKVGEKQTVAFDLSIISKELEHLDIDYDTDLEFNLIVKDREDEVLFEKTDSAFMVKSEREEVWVQFMEEDLSETGAYKVELMIKIYSGDTKEWIEKSEDLEMTIKKSLHDGGD